MDNAQFIALIKCNKKGCGLECSVVAPLWRRTKQRQKEQEIVHCPYCGKLAEVLFIQRADKNELPQDERELYLDWLIEDEHT